MKNETIGIFNVPAGVRKTALAGNIALKIVKKATYADVHQLADELIGGRTVLLDLNDVPERESERILDFLRGAAYAVGGSVNRNVNCVYILAPRDVEVAVGERGAKINGNEVSGAREDTNE